MILRNDMLASKRLSRMMRRLTIAATLSALLGAPASGNEDTAKAILKSMSDYMAAQQTISLSFDSDIEVITPQMEKIQFTNSGKGLLSRPDKLRAHRIGGYSEVELIYDGNTITIHDRGGNGYARIEAPGTVDQLIGSLKAGHGIALPGGDLLLTNAYEVLMADVTEAKYIGHGVIDGRACEHVAFRNFDTDWQIWVEIGDRPIPCKMVITSKTINNAPQYTLRITGWESGIDIAPDAFAFVPPEGARQLDPNDLMHLDELPAPLDEGGSQ